MTSCTRYATQQNQCYTFNSFSVVGDRCTWDDYGTQTLAVSRHLVLKDTRCGTFRTIATVRTEICRTIAYCAVL